MGTEKMPAHPISGQCETIWETPECRKPDKYNICGTVCTNRWKCPVCYSGVVQYQFILSLDTEIKVQWMVIKDVPHVFGTFKPVHSGCSAKAVLLEVGKVKPFSRFNLEGSGEDGDLDHSLRLPWTGSWHAAWEEQAVSLIVSSTTLKAAADKVFGESPPGHAEAVVKTGVDLAMEHRVFMKMFGDCRSLAQDHHWHLDIRVFWGTSAVEAGFEGKRFWDMNG